MYCFLRKVFEFKPPLSGGQPTIFVHMEADMLEKMMEPPDDVTVGVAWRIGAAIGLTKDGLICQEAGSQLQHRAAAIRAPGHAS